MPLKFNFQYFYGRAVKRMDGYNTIKNYNVRRGGREHKASPPSSSRFVSAAMYKVLAGVEMLENEKSSSLARLLSLTRPVLVCVW